MEENCSKAETLQEGDFPLLILSCDPQPTNHSSTSTRLFQKHAMSQPHLSTIPKSCRSQLPTNNWKHWLYTSNPFYAISTAFVIVGFRMWTDTQGLDSTLWWLMSGLAAFSIILASVCVALTRWGKLWEDTRSLFFLLDLIFFFMSASLDRPIQEGHAGSHAMPIIGLGFAIGLSEFVIRGTGIHLAKYPRICHHLCLAFTFLAPLILSNFTDNTTLERSLSLHVLTLLWPLCFLLLLPACQPGHKKGRDPWVWPWIPLAPFIFLIIISIGRCFLLAISFGPGTQYDVVLSLSHLVPLLWVIGILLQRIQLPHPVLAKIGRALPWISLLLISIDQPSNRFQEGLLQSITTNLGSPLFLATLYLCLHNLIISIKTGRHTVSASLSIFALTFIEPDFHGIDAGMSLQWHFMGLFLSWCCFQIWKHHSSIHALTLAVTSLFLITEFSSHALPNEWHTTINIHGVIFFLLLTTLCFKDPWSQKLKSFSLILSLGTLILYSTIIPKPTSSPVLTHTYIFIFTTILLSWSYLLKSRSAVIISLLGFGWQLIHAINLLIEGVTFTSNQRGPLLLSAGIASLILGITISLKKMRCLNFSVKQFESLLPHLHPEGSLNPFAKESLLRSFSLIFPLMVFLILTLTNSHHCQKFNPHISGEHELRDIGLALIENQSLNHHTHFSNDALQKLQLDQPELFSNNNITLHPNLTQAKIGDEHQVIGLLWLQEDSIGILLYADIHLERITSKPNSDVWNTTESKSPR